MDGIEKFRDFFLKIYKIDVDDMGPKNRVVMAATYRLYTQSVDGTGLTQILKDAKTSRSQFFRFFKSKDELLLEIIQTISLDATNPQWHFNKLDDIETFLDDWIDFTEKSQGYFFCPLATIGLFADPTQQQLSEKVQELYYALRDAEMTPFFDQFIIDHGIKDTTGEELSNFVDVNMWGGRLNAVWIKDINTFVHAKKHVMRYLRSLESDD